MAKQTVSYGAWIRTRRLCSSKRATSPYFKLTASRLLNSNFWCNILSPMHIFMYVYCVYADMYVYFSDKPISSWFKPLFTYRFVKNWSEISRCWNFTVRVHRRCQRPLLPWRLQNVFMRAQSPERKRVIGSSQTADVPYRLTYILTWKSYVCDRQCREIYPAILAEARSR